MLSHLLVVGLMAVVMIGAIVNFFSLGRSFDDTMDREFPSMTRAHDVLKAAYDVEAALPIPGGEPDERRLQRGLEDLRSAVKRLSSPELPTGAVAPIEQVFTFLESLELAVRAKQWAGARKSVNSVEGYAGAMFSESQTHVQAAGAETQVHAAGAFLRSILVTVAALFVATLLAVRLMKLALTPLALIAKHADMIATGDLSTQIDLSRTDEVGRLADSFNSMASRLSEMRHSEVRRLRRAQLMSDVALESLYDPVIVTDARGRIRSLNRAAQGLFGAAPDSPRRHVADHVKESRIVKAVERAIGGQVEFATEDEQGQLSIKVGTAERTYRIRATPMKDDDGLLLGSVVVLEDITHLKVVDQMKTEFIAVASHELRTPVTSLLLSAQLLEEGAAGPLNADQLGIVKSQRVDLERLQRLMSDILDLTRLEQGVTPPRFELVSASEVVEGVRHEFELVAAEKGVRLAIETSPADLNLRADRIQVHRALANLVSNAIRHTPAAGSVTLAASKRRNDVIFTVADTGEGIPLEFQSLVFERFVQVPARAQGGAGLGLAIVQSIVHAHGGSLTLQSDPGHGTIFKLVLPQKSATRLSEGS